MPIQTQLLIRSTCASAHPDEVHHCKFKEVEDTVERSPDQLQGFLNCLFTIRIWYFGPLHTLSNEASVKIKHINLYGYS